MRPNDTPMPFIVLTEDQRIYLEYLIIGMHCYHRIFRKNTFDPIWKAMSILVRNTRLSLGWKILWRRAQQPTPVFFPGESTVETGGLQSRGLWRVGHNWSDLEAMHKYTSPFVPLCVCVCMYVHSPPFRTFLYFNLVLIV